MEPTLVYDQWHARLNVDTDSNTPWHQLVKAHIETNHLIGKRVLEIGCGRGGFALWLASQSDSPKELFAADFSPIAVQMGKTAGERLGLDIRWQVADITNLEFDSESFDTVISCETVEHLQEVRKGIRELARVLKPGGTLFLTTPNYFSTIGIYRGYMRLTGRRFTEEGQPINRFMMLPVTRSLIASSGMTIIQTDALGHYLPIPGRPPVRIRALDKPRQLLKWFGLHSFVMASKPSAWNCKCAVPQR